MKNFVRVTDTEGADIFLNLNHIAYIYQLEDDDFAIVLNQGFEGDTEVIEVTNLSGLKLINYLNVFDCGDDESFQEEDTIF